MIVIFLLLDLVVTENMHTTTHISQLMEGGLQSLLQQHTPPDDPPVGDSEVMGAEGSAESTPNQQDGEEAHHQIQDESPAANHQDLADMSGAVNGENNAECRVFTDMGGDWDGDSEPPTDSEEPGLQQAEVTQLTPCREHVLTEMQMSLDG